MGRWIRKEAFTVGDTSVLTLQMSRDFPGEPGERRSRQCLQSRRNRMGIGKGRGQKTLFSTVITSSTGIYWKCHQLPLFWPSWLSYPSHPISSFHICLLSYFLDLKTQFTLLSLPSHVTPVWSISSSVLIVTWTSNFNGTPAAFFSFTK